MAAESSDPPQSPNESCAYEDQHALSRDGLVAYSTLPQYDSQNLNSDGRELQNDLNDTLGTATVERSGQPTADPTTTNHKRRSILRNTSWTSTKPMQALAGHIKHGCWLVRSAALRSPATGNVGSRSDIGHSFNQGWYGRRPLTTAEYYSPSLPSPFTDRSLAIQRFERDTKTIDELYGESPVFYRVFDLVSFLLWRPVEQYFDAVSVPKTVVDNSDDPSFSILTSFYGNLEYFKQTACSVEMIEANWPNGRLEWVINNDDPATPNQALLNCVPASLRNYVRLIGGSVNLGITQGINFAIRSATKQWLLFLDCDDILARNTISILTHYIRSFKKCRYISSGLIDIDEHNKILRQRLHVHPPTKLFSAGMIAGHLKAIRCDLLIDIGLLDSAFDLAQDYEFALRVAAVEPLLLIPDYLYYYRWHKNTQSVSKLGRQIAARDRARESTILRLSARRALPTWRLGIVFGSLKIAHFLERNAPIVLACGLVVGRKVWRLFKRSKRIVH
jgi:glycosyltransferase involved in cell wall biosynthesis